MDAWTLFNELQAMDQATRAKVLQSLTVNQLTALKQLISKNGGTRSVEPWKRGVEDKAARFEREHARFVAEDKAARFERALAEDKAARFERAHARLVAEHGRLARKNQKEASLAPYGGGRKATHLGSRAIAKAYFNG